MSLTLENLKKQADALQANLAKQQADATKVIADALAATIAENISNKTKLLQIEATKQAGLGNYEATIKWSFINNDSVEFAAVQAAFPTFDFSRNTVGLITFMTMSWR